MIDAFVGTIMMVSFDFAPRGWMLCDGSLLPIQSHSALYTLIGTSYGGDGVKTFALPDLRGHVPAGMGQLANGTGYTLGASGALAAAPASGSGEPQFTGVNFLICSQGTFPSRQ